MSYILRWCIIVEKGESRICLLYTSLACETLLKLKEDYRVLIHMYYIEGLSIKEMIEITEMKEKTLRSKLARAVKKYEKIYFASE